MNSTKPIIFGAAYYEEYLPYDRLREDFDLMREAGFNTIRIAESTWSTEEPSDGVFDFSHIDRVLDMAEEYNIDVIIGTPTYAVPHWLVMKDKDVIAVTKDAQPLYGARQIMDITNETYLFHAERIIRKLVSHTAGRKCVIGFQLDNETKHYGTSGKNVQKGFRKYLENKFGTVEEMNLQYGFAYWSNSVASFDELPDVNGTINASYACAFEEYQRKLASDFLLWQRKIVDEYRRADQFVTQNFDFDWKPFGAPGTQDGYSHGLQNGINHFDAAAALTVAGVDVYHNTQDKLTGMEIAFAGDEMRNLKSDNSDYLVLETQAQAFREWLPYPNQLRLHAIAHLASGAKGIMYWNFFSIHNSKETYWKGLLSHDFKRNPTFDEACVIGRELKTLSEKLANVSRKNTVAVMVSNNSMTALKWFPTDKNVSYNDILLKYYKALYDLNIECDIIFEDKENYENDYKVIITPQLYAVCDKTVKRLRTFVENGGTLISSFRSFVTDENIKVFPTSLPGGMTDVFSTTYNQYTKPENVKVSHEYAENWIELLNSENAETLFYYQHKYWGKYSAVTKNHFKKGTAVYIGADVGEKTLKEILLSSAVQSGVCVSDYRFPICEKTFEKDGKAVKFFMNFSSDEAEITAPFDCVDLICEKEFIKGEKIKLTDYNAVILGEK